MDNQKTTSAGSHNPSWNLNRALNALLAPGTEHRVEAFNLFTDIEFPDVSFYQLEINWVKMAATGVPHVIIRGGQGKYEDPRFRDNWSRAKKQGIGRSIYWFYDDRVSPKDQSEKLNGLIKGDLPEGNIWFDWESTYKGKYSGLKNVVASMELTEQKYPTVPVGMYTGYYWFVENSNVIKNYPQYQYLKRHKLWLAQYREGGNGLLIPFPWKVPELEVHQYGTPSRGKEFGCGSIEVDMNRVLSNKSFYSKRAPQPPLEEGDLPPYVEIRWMKVTTYKLNIRNEPGNTSKGSDIGDLYKGELVCVNDYMMVNDVPWYHIIEALTIEGKSIRTTDDTLVNKRSDCWVSGEFLTNATVTR